MTMGAGSSSSSWHRYIQIAFSALQPCRLKTTRFPRGALGAMNIIRSFRSAASCCPSPVPVTTRSVSGKTPHAMRSTSSQRFPLLDSRGLLHGKAILRFEWN